MKIVTKRQKLVSNDRKVNTFHWKQKNLKEIQYRLHLFALIVMGGNSSDVYFKVKFNIFCSWKQLFYLLPLCGGYIKFA